MIIGGKNEATIAVFHQRGVESLYLDPLSVTREPVKLYKIFTIWKKLLISELIHLELIFKTKNVILLH